VATTKRRRMRRWMIAMAVGAGVLVLFAVVIVLSLPALMRALVVREARARGVDLVVRQVDPGWGWVRLRDAEVTFRGIDGVRVKLVRATIDLRGVSPSRVEVRGMQVGVQGSAADVMLDVAAFAKAQPDALQFPIAAEGVSVEWKERARDDPWLRIHDATVLPASRGVRLRAPEASVLDVSVGPVGASWSSDGGSATLGFGQEDPTLALVRLDVPHGLEAKDVLVTLRSMRLGDLQRPLGVTMPIGPDTMVSGNASIALRADRAGAIAGTMHVSLRGWVPPHPRELNGIVFGEETTFDTKFSVDAARRQVKLGGSRVAAGAFVLQGGGVVDRRGDHATIAMDMSGAIPCQALAKSAVDAHLPGPVGDFIGDVVKGALKGAVTVTVSVRADTRALGAADVKHTVSPGCGFKL
jgi:hypothetical protein